MPFVLDSSVSVSVDITHFVIRDFSIEPDSKLAMVKYRGGVYDPDGNFIPAVAKALSISGSNYENVVKRAEEINANEELGVYDSVKQSLYEYVADHEGLSGSVE